MEDGKLLNGETSESQDDVAEGETAASDNTEKPMTSEDLFKLRMEIIPQLL